MDILDVDPIIASSKLPKKFHRINIVIGLIIAGLIAVAGMFAYRYYSLNQHRETNNPSSTSVPTTSPTPKTNHSSFTCPSTAWIDCMPGPGPVKNQCQSDYLNWAKQNCPGFKGAAY